MPKRPRPRDGAEYFHLKITYDHTWDWAKLCKQLCGAGDLEVLCVAEKLEQNAHVHIQGQTILSRNAFEAVRNEWRAKHWLVNEDGGENRRPWKVCKHEINEKGYQYMSKEGRPPLYQFGFTEDDLSEMKARSDEHVRALKTGLRDHISTLSFNGSVQQVYRAIRKAAIAWYQKDEKWPSQPNRFKSDLLRAMMEHPAATPAWKEYVEEAMAPTP